MNQQRGLKNLLIGLISKLIMMSLGIIIPRLVLVSLGSESNGLLNSVTSILTYMSLLEAGVGIASLQALYRPCADKDKEGVNKIIAATDHFYKRTGVIYFACVIVLSVAYTLAVKSTLPKIDIFVVVLMTGLSGVISYFSQGKYRILLQAEGKNYIITSITTIANIAINAAKAILLITGFDVVAIQISYFTINILQMVAYKLYIKKHYAWIDLKVKPDFDAISQKNAVLLHQISGMIFSNTDVLVLTLFRGLKEVSVYTLYALIYGLVSSINETISESYRYALGQSYNTDRDRFNRLFNIYEIFVLAFSFALFVVCRAVIGDFLVLYTAGVEDIQYIDKYLPWMFAIYYIMNNGRVSSSAVISISQHFEDTKWRSVFESIINLTVSVICVNFFGIYGVLMGTIAALLYRTNDMIIYASKILKRSCLITYRRWLLNIALFGLMSLLLEQFTIPATNYLQLVLSVAVVSLVTIAVFIGINALCEPKSAKYVSNIVINALHSIKTKLRPSTR